MKLIDVIDKNNVANTGLVRALKESKTIIYNLQNGLEKRRGIELQVIIDQALKDK